MRYEWDPKKEKINITRHGLSFDDAVPVFDDEKVVEALDETHSEAEVRFNIIGLTSRGLLFVVFTEPVDDLVRIISARKATKFEENIYAQK